MSESGRQKNKKEHSFGSFQRSFPKESEVKELEKIDLFTGLF